MNPYSILIITMALLLASCCLLILLFQALAQNRGFYSFLFQLIAVGYAIMTTRSLDLNWKMRALRVLPMFLLPAVSFITYSGLRSFIKMCKYFSAPFNYHYFSFPFCWSPKEILSYFQLYLSVYILVTA